MFDLAVPKASEGDAPLTALDHRWCALCSAVYNTELHPKMTFKNEKTKRKSRGEEFACYKFSQSNSGQVVQHILVLHVPSRQNCIKNIISLNFIIYQINTTVLCIMLVTSVKQAPLDQAECHRLTNLIVQLLRDVRKLLKELERLKNVNWIM